MFADKERESMTIGERVYGCTGALGLIQAFAAGYFLYDLIVSTVYIKMFGIGMLFHAISALWVFSFGFVSNLFFFFFSWRVPFLCLIFISLFLFLFFRLPFI